MTIDLYDLPDGMDEKSIVTVTVGELRNLYADGYALGDWDDGDYHPVKVEIAGCPWLGDLD